MTGTSLPDHFGPYESITPLAAGGMGEVYRARDIRLNREVAIKVLPGGFSADPIRLRRFEQEARAAAALNHPAILAIYDVGVENGMPYIVSELLEGKTLRECINDHPMPVRKVVTYAIQIARGLEAAHEKGIVHRDLKPENIFITHDQRAKILDFGLVKLTLENSSSHDAKTQSIPVLNTESDVVLGTPAYMSPEQIRGLPADHRSDIFAFGAVVYEMLSGERPFKGSTRADITAAILREEPESLMALNPKMPPVMEQIVNHCLVKEPRGRFQSIGDVAFNLEEMSTVSGSGKLDSRWVQPEPPSPMRLWRKIAIGAAVIVGVGLLTFWAAKKWLNPPPIEYQRLTFQQGSISSARFSADTETVLFAARFSSTSEVYSARLDSVGLRPLGINADAVLSVSSAGELAILQSKHTVAGLTAVGVLARVPLAGGAPRQVLSDVQAAAWSPDGSELAVVHYVPESHVYRLEYPLGHVLYQTAGWISDPRFSPDGQTIAFADHPVFGDDQGFVSTIPAAGGSIQHLTRSWESLQKLAWHPNGRQVWFTAANAGFYYSLYAVDRSQKQRMVLTVPGGVELEDIAPDGKVLLDHYVERTLLMVSTKDHREERDLSWLDNVEFFRFSSDGNQILLGDESEGSGRKHATFIRNVDGSPAVRLGDGDGIVLSPDDKWALSSLPPNQLRLLPTGTGELQVLSHSDPTGDPKSGIKPPTKIRADLPAEWFPDGKRIAYIGDDNRTHLLDLSGNDTVLTETGTTGYLVAPDGQHVLVQTAAGQYELYPVSGGQPVAVSWLRPQDLPVRFSADGKALFIAVPKQGSRGRDLFRVELSDGRRTLLWHIQSPNNGISNDAWYVDITPDGTGYAYSYRQKSCALFVVNGLK